jgi:hypothetical protein
LDLPAGMNHEGLKTFNAQRSTLNLQLVASLKVERSKRACSPFMNPLLHTSQEGNLQPVPQTELPSSEGLGVGSWEGSISI